LTRLYKSMVVGREIVLVSFLGNGRNRSHVLSVRDGGRRLVGILHPSV
jgi:hypothetical protein